MTIHGTNTSAAALTRLQPPSPWVCSLLGIVLILAGLLIPGDVVLATVISAIAGVFEVVHAFWTKGWGGFA